MSEPAASHVADAPVVAARLRRVTRLAVALGVVIAACGFLPGTRVYEDSRNCFGVALGAVLTEAHSSGCTPSYDRLTTTRLAGGVPLALYLVIALAPAIFVYRNPRRRRAWQWTIWSVVCLLLAIVLFSTLEFHLDLLSRTETLWPARVVEIGVGMLQMLLLIGLPIIVRSPRKQVEPALPEARIHRD